MASPEAGFESQSKEAGMCSERGATSFQSQAQEHVGVERRHDFNSLLGDLL